MLQEHPDYKYRPRRKQKSGQQAGHPPPPNQQPVSTPGSQAARSAGNSAAAAGAKGATAAKRPSGGAHPQVVQQSAKGSAVIGGTLMSGSTLACSAASMPSGYGAVSVATIPTQAIMQPLGRSDLYPAAAALNGYAYATAGPGGTIALHNMDPNTMNALYPQQTLYAAAAGQPQYAPMHAVAAGGHTFLTNAYMPSYLTATQMSQGYAGGQAGSVLIPLPNAQMHLQQQLNLPAGFMAVSPKPEHGAEANNNAAAAAAAAAAANAAHATSDYSVSANR